VAINGFGKAIGFTQINELGTIETPNSVDQHANATSERFAPIENTCELIATAPAAAEAPPTETTPEVTTTEEPETPEPGIPEEILACTEELGKASGTDTTRTADSAGTGCHRQNVLASSKTKSMPT